MRIERLVKLVLSIVICEAAGVLGSVFTMSEIQRWYAGLVKPALNPPSWVFGPVWTTLYFLMGVALFLVWNADWRVQYPLHIHKNKKAWNRYSARLWTGSWQRGNIISIFAIQLLLNVLWSVLFFGLHAPLLAFFDMLALWCSIIYVIINFYRVSKPAAYLLLPYLLWVTFAGYLNVAIWILNA